MAFVKRKTTVAGGAAKFAPGDGDVAGTSVHVTSDSAGTAVAAAEAAEKTPGGVKAAADPNA